MMVIPGQVKGETKLIRRLRRKKQMEKKVCIVYTIQSGKFYRCFLFACGSLLVALFLFFLSSSFFPRACLYQLWLKIFCMCLCCKPSNFPRDLVW